MAEEKKKSAAPMDKVSPGRELTFLLAGLFLLAVILGQITFYLSSIGWGNIGNAWNYFLHSYIYPFWENWKVVAVIISAACIVWMAYSFKKLREVIDADEKIYGPAEEDTFLKEAMTEINPRKKGVEKWERVMSHAYSESPADWRLAIMEADILLEESLRAKGFAGESIGEILKNMKPGDLVALEAAWDAHKVRNRIAHSGGDFELNERETRRVVALYETVLKELEAI